jgi:hypothetical protein
MNSEVQEAVTCEGCGFFGFVNGTDSLSLVFPTLRPCIRPFSVLYPFGVRIGFMLAAAGGRI